MNRRGFLRFLGLGAVAAPVVAIAGVPALPEAPKMVGWAEGLSPSSVNASARAMMADIAMWRETATETVYLTPPKKAFMVDMRGRPYPSGIPEWSE